MKLWVLSDLHREFGGWEPLYAPEANVAVVAGDVREGLVRSMRWLQQEIGRHMPVVMVAGNHEFYRHSIIESFMDARAVADRYPDVHLLEDSSVVLGGTRFIGSTLWTDYEVMMASGDGDLATATGDRDRAREWAMEVARTQLNDHRAIALQKHPWQRWTPGTRGPEARRIQGLPRGRAGAAVRRPDRRRHASRAAPGEHPLALRGKEPERGLRVGPVVSHREGAA